MRALVDVTPTAEQLSLFSRVNCGVEVIRGAAGSGKTTSALLKLRSSIGFFLNRRRRANSTVPVRILVLTYNRTLSGYVTELASKQFAASAGIELEVSTFAKWAMSAVGNPRMIENRQRLSLINQLAVGLNLPPIFVQEEVEYLMGRFLPENFAAYLTTRREGRGATPRMERHTRESLLGTVVIPYADHLQRIGYHDWNDLAVKLVNEKHFTYDIVIVDEAQDFSANQIRAVMNQLAELHTVTFILDTAQRIYARGFTWQEVDITVRPENSFRLSKNYRNTREIAAFAASIVQGLKMDDDGTIPNFNSADRSGPRPIVLRGSYSRQIDYALEYLQTNINLNEESVAFLHPKGGEWFDYLRAQLINHGFPFVEISREAEWPQGSENIALSTLHSSKGLEFDHVIILGLNAEVLPHGNEDDDDKLSTLRRLIAMGVGRAKNSVVLGYKSEDRSRVFDFFNASTFDEVPL